MRHYTSKPGFDAIRSQPVWWFKANKPPDAKPHGAYFTTLGPATLNLAKRLRIPRAKLAYQFVFSGAEGLRPLEGDRGEYILFSPEDYPVSPGRQDWHGKTGIL